MKRRHFLTGLSALGMAALGSRIAVAAPSGTRLIVADQNEFLRQLLEASGERKSLDVALELPNFAGGPAIFEAIRAGALDVAYVGDTPPIQARAAGVKLPIIATFTRELSQYRLVQRAGAGVEKLSDLRGKRLSYVEGSGRQVFLIDALKRGGLTLADVQLVNLRVADLNDALRAKAVDVAVLLEPHVTRLAKQIGATTVPDPEERKLLPSTSYLYARPEVLADAQKSQAIAAFIAAFVRAGTWSNAHEEEWGRFYFTQFQRIDAAGTAAILAGQSPLKFQTAAEAIPHHQKLIDILYEAKAVPQRFDAAGAFVSTYDKLIVANR